jgi:hypothetical protein
MSSVGLLIATDQVLSPGMRVKVEVSWPVKLDERVYLKLVVLGRIVRTESGTVALAGLKISRHAFHTAADPIF